MDRLKNKLQFNNISSTTTGSSSSHFIALHWFFVLGLCSQPTLGSISLWLVLLRFVPAQGVPKGWNLAA